MHCQGKAEMWGQWVPGVFNDTPMIFGFVFDAETQVTHWFLQSQQPFSNSSWFKDIDELQAEIFFSFGRNSRDVVAFCGQTGKPSCVRLTGLSKRFFGLQCAKICQDLSGNLIQMVEPVLVFHAHKSKHQQNMQQSPVVYLSTDSSEAPCWNCIFQVEKTGILETSCQATADMACPKPSSDAQPSLPEVCKLKWYAIVWWSFRKIWMALIFSFPKVQLWPLPKSCWQFKEVGWSARFSFWRCEVFFCAPRSAS